jgi:hypothetical protein
MRKSKVQEILLGPGTTFRNGHRTCIYFGFIMLVLGSLCLLRYQLP